MQLNTQFERYVFVLQIPRLKISNILWMKTSTSERTYVSKKWILLQDDLQVNISDAQTFLKWTWWRATRERDMGQRPMCFWSTMCSSQHAMYKVAIKYEGKIKILGSQIIFPMCSFYEAIKRCIQQQKRGREKNL